MRAYVVANLRCKLKMGLLVDGVSRYTRIIRKAHRSSFNQLSLLAVSSSWKNVYAFHCDAVFRFHNASDWSLWRSSSFRATDTSPSFGPLYIYMAQETRDFRRLRYQSNVRTCWKVRQRYTSDGRSHHFEQCALFMRSIPPRHLDPSTFR